MIRGKWFKKAYSRYFTDYYDEVAGKMLGRGDGKRVVPVSCKSSFCLRCSNVYYKI